MAIKFLSFIFLTILALTQKSWSMERLEERPLELQLQNDVSRQLIRIIIRPSTSISEIKEKIAEKLNKVAVYEEKLTADNIILRYRAGGAMHDTLDALAFKAYDVKPTKWVHDVRNAKLRDGKTGEVIDFSILSAAKGKTVTVTIEPSTTILQIKEKVAEELNEMGLYERKLTAGDITLPPHNRDEQIFQEVGGFAAYWQYNVRPLKPKPEFIKIKELSTLHDKLRETEKNIAQMNIGVIQMNITRDSLLEQIRNLELEIAAIQEASRSATDTPAA